MNKLYFSLFCLSIFFSACSPSVKFGISQKYYLDEDEKEAAITQSTTNKYEQIINIDTLNIPLNKLILTKNYKVYLGVSLYNKSLMLNEIYKSDTNRRILDSRIDQNNVSILAKLNNEYYYSYIYDSNNDHLTYILTFESDSTNVKKKYNNSFLTKKLINDK